MDITRNWRLKMSRSQLLAARRPDGSVILPQQTARPADQNGVYVFRQEAPVSEGDVEYSQAAR